MPRQKSASITLGMQYQSWTLQSMGVNWPSSLWMHNWECVSSSAGIKFLEKFVTAFFNSSLDSGRYKPLNARAEVASLCRASEGKYISFVCQAKLQVMKRRRILHFSFSSSVDSIRFQKSVIVPPQRLVSSQLLDWMKSVRVPTVPFGIRLLFRHDRNCSPNSLRVDSGETAALGSNQFKALKIVAWSGGIPNKGDPS